MPGYFSPGVYVEEVPSAVKPITGVSTSTAGFIGIFDWTVEKTETLTVPGDGTLQKFTLQLAGKPASGKQVEILDPSNNNSAVADVTLTVTPDGMLTLEFTKKESTPKKPMPITVTYRVADPAPDTAQQVVTVSGDGTTKIFKFGGQRQPDGSVTVTDSTGAAATDPTPSVTADGTLTLTFTNPPALGTQSFKVSYKTRPAQAVPVLCTNFTEFTRTFGGFSTVPERNYLAHAVYGFFNNGGGRCYVAWVPDKGSVQTALDAFAAIDEIALVAAPGSTDNGVRDALIAHCERLDGAYYRVAILDGPKTKDATGGPKNTSYAAWYLPWITALDPITNTAIPVPPSGHVAGIYARVDNARGVHKAPANEPILGALDVTTPLSRNDQNGLNPQGVNCIRVLNNNILVWGARTVGGDANADLKYVNVRRTLLFLRKSIEQGTQWVVFEPNTPALWQKITRNVTAFLTTVWRSGALFGTTPQEAFYVKCDGETNPSDLRDLGQVVTEIGVAIVRPAEFVVFRLSQWSSPS